MTHAICYKCGARKLGAFVACPECKVKPNTETSLVLSLAFTDHYFELDELEEIGITIRETGEPPLLEADSHEHILKQLHADASILSDLGLDANATESIRNERIALSEATKPHDVKSQDSKDMDRLIDAWLRSDTNAQVGSSAPGQPAPPYPTTLILDNINQLATLVAAAFHNEAGARSVKRLLKTLSLQVGKADLPGSAFLTHLDFRNQDLHSIATLAFTSDCLRFIGTSLLASSKYKANGVSMAHSLVRPLSQVLSTAIDRYSEFHALSPDQVGDFLTFFGNDEDVFGGNIESDTFLLGGTMCILLSLLNGDSIALDLYESIILSIHSELISDKDPTSRKDEANRSVQATKEYVTHLRKFVSLYRDRDPAAIKVKPESLVPSKGPKRIVLPNPGNVTPEGSVKVDLAAIRNDALAELDSLTGLYGVKKEVRRLMSFLKIQLERRRHGLRESGQTLHFVFTGNPGTGKTTVARIVSKILHGFGILKSTKVIECDRSELVGGYLGQTAIKTDEKIEEAIDGVLFIDEAYTLAGDPLAYGHGDMFGDEARNTLLKRMEDFRDRLVVIAAGYPAPMQKFIRANPGLESRFTRYITFEDYSVADLCQIFEKFCRDAEYSLSPSGRAWTSILFTIAHNERDERFGNARFVRNVFERALSLHSERLADMPESLITKEALVTLDGTDVSFEFVKSVDRSQIDVSKARWFAECPNCRAKIRGSASVLGRRASCKKCFQEFLFPWWSLQPNTVEGVSVELEQGSIDQGGMTGASSVVTESLRPFSEFEAAPAIFSLPPIDKWSEDRVRGQALLAQGIGHLQRGSAKEAIRCFDDAIGSDWGGSNPSCEQYFLYRAKAFGVDGEERPMQAMSEYNSAAYSRSLGHHRESEGRYLRAMELDPEFLWASNNLAWMMSTDPDGAVRNGPVAVQHALHACGKSDWHCWSFIDTLAASYAECGEFAMAIACSERALLLAPAGVRTGLQRMLECFLAGKAFRDINR
jgi:AAA+ superfamily predicted ATPase